MPSSKNNVILACAGAGKTERIVNDALAEADKPVAILTYTNTNATEIVRRFTSKLGYVPKHVEVMTWFSFLLRECARPYQNSVFTGARIAQIYFVEKQGRRFASQNDPERFYFYGNRAYSDRLASFVIECDKKTGGCVMRRLARLYEKIVVDEFQDIAGWDLELVGLILHTDIEVSLVGDPRQWLLSTSATTKNKQYRGTNLTKLLTKWQDRGICTLEFLSDCHRCNQMICDLASSLWPEMPPLNSLSEVVAGHDGIFVVSREAVHEYVAKFRPMVLRNDRDEDTLQYQALNFGLSKGLQSDHVLIFPTKKMSAWLSTGCYKGSRERLYVAITRARHSVAFVHDESPAILAQRWGYVRFPELFDGVR